MLAGLQEHTADVVVRLPQPGRLAVDAGRPARREGVGHHQQRGPVGHRLDDDPLGRVGKDPRGAERRARRFRQRPELGGVGSPHQHRLLVAIEARGEDRFERRWLLVDNPSPSDDIGARQRVGVRVDAVARGSVDQDPAWRRRGSVRVEGQHDAPHGDQIEQFGTRDAAERQGAHERKGSVRGWGRLSGDGAQVSRQTPRAHRIEVLQNQHPVERSLADEDAKAEVESVTGEGSSAVGSRSRSGRKQRHARRQVRRRQRPGQVVVVVQRSDQHDQHESEGRELDPPARGSPEGPGPGERGETVGRSERTQERHEEKEPGR